MKRLLNGLLLVLLLFPVLVKADMAAPGTLPYEAIVSKDGGADYYDHSIEYTKVGHLDKDTVIVIEAQYERIDKNLTYLYFCTTDTNNDCHYIKSTDIIPKKEGLVSPKTEHVSKLKEPVEFMVAVDEVEIREGPSLAYKVVGTLKKGYIGKYSYYYEADIYVEENGMKGWINVLGHTIVSKVTGAITATTVSTKCGDIPANTVLTDVWKASNWDQVSLIRYNNCEDFVETTFSSSIFLINFTHESSTKDSTTKLYADPDLKNVITFIPEGEKYTFLACYRICYCTPQYVEYNGTRGWLMSDEEMDKCNKMVAESSSNPAQESQESQKTDPVVTTPTEESTTNPFSDPKEDVVGDVAPNEETQDEDNTTETKKISTRDIIIMCCIGGIALAVVAIVTIVLVNKGKKKVEVASVETPPVTEETPTEPIVEETPEVNQEENK